jgi:hypothetical protein
MADASELWLLALLKLPLVDGVGAVLLVEVRLDECKRGVPCKFMGGEARLGWVLEFLLSVPGNKRTGDGVDAPPA